jgi:hypothetical protein
MSENEAYDEFDELYAGALAAALAEIERLQGIIDSRPAINAGLPETYIQWSQSIYEMEAYRIVATPS